MNSDSEARREGARQADGKFGPQEHAEAAGGLNALDFGDMFAEFDHMVEEAKYAEANRVARQTYPELYDGQAALLRHGQYVGALDLARRAFFAATGMNPEPRTWAKDADEFEPGYGQHDGRWMVVAGPSGGVGDTEDEAWRNFVADVITARMEGGESEADIALWFYEVNAREDRIDKVIEERGGVRFNALYRAGEEPCDTTTAVTLEIDGYTGLSDVHNLCSDGERITQADLAQKPDYYRGVVAGIAAAYGPLAGKAFLESIKTGELAGTFTHRASAGDVRKAVVSNIPCPFGMSAAAPPLPDDQVERNDEYLRGANHALTSSNAYWQLGLEDDLGGVEEID